MVRPRRAEQFLPKEDDPVAGCTPHQFIAAVAASPPLPDPASRVLRVTLGGTQRCTPWHRSPSYDLRRTPCDHPDFTCNALHEDLFKGSLNNQATHPCSLAYPLLARLSRRRFMPSRRTKGEFSRLIFLLETFSSVPA